MTVFKKGLEQQGYSVDAYNDPQQAIREFKPNYYHDVIVDIRMPKINGFDLARAIWQKEPNAAVCFFTAFEIYEGEANKVFKDLNTKCFVKKPVSVEALVQHIEKHLSEE